MSLDRRWPPDRLTAVLFDLDDTLIDSFDARVAALERVFAKFDIRGRSAHEFMRDLGGNQLMIALEHLESELGSTVGLYEAYRVLYWTEETDTIRPFPGIEPLLTAISKAGLRTGVVTQKRRNFDIQGRSAGAMREVSQVGLSEAFPVVIGMEDVTRFKPHPEGIRLAMKILGAHPTSTLMVGDSFPDMEAGRAAGCWTCHATWGLPVGSGALGGVRPDIVAASPDELRTLILGLPGN